MKRAEALEAPPGLSERHEVLDDLDNVGLRLEVVDEAVRHHHPSAERGGSFGLLLHDGVEEPCSLLLGYRFPGHELSDELLDRLTNAGHIQVHDDRGLSE